MNVFSACVLMFFYYSQCFDYRLLAIMLNFLKPSEITKMEPIKKRPRIRV